MVAGPWLGAHGRPFTASIIVGVPAVLNTDDYSLARPFLIEHAPIADSKPPPVGAILELLDVACLVATEPDHGLANPRGLPVVLASEVQELTDSVV